MNTPDDGLTEPVRIPESQSNVEPEASSSDFSTHPPRPNVYELPFCILCGAEIHDMGHNPEPLASYDDGRACDTCNDTKVIPARLMAIQQARTKLPSWVMVLHGRASDGWRPTEDVMYLESFAADANDGGGDATWTTDPDRALRFDNPGDLLNFWRQQSEVKPIRDDGQPNRPLTAWTVEPRNLG